MNFGIQKWSGEEISPGLYEEGGRSSPPSVAQEPFGAYSLVASRFVLISLGIASSLTDERFLPLSLLALSRLRFGLRQSQDRLRRLEVAGRDVRGLQCGVPPPCPSCSISFRGCWGSFRLPQSDADRLQPEPQNLRGTYRSCTRRVRPLAARSYIPLQAGICPVPLYCGIGFGLLASKDVPAVHLQQCLSVRYIPRWHTASGRHRVPSVPWQG